MYTMQVPGDFYKDLTPAGANIPVLTPDGGMQQEFKSHNAATKKWETSTGSAQGDNRVNYSHRRILI